MQSPNFYLYIGDPHVLRIRKFEPLFIPYIAQSGYTNIADMFVTVAVCETVPAENFGRKQLKPPRGKQGMSIFENFWLLPLYPRRNDEV